MFILKSLLYSDLCVCKFQYSCGLFTPDQEKGAFCVLVLSYTITTLLTCTLPLMSRDPQLFRLPATETRKHLFYFLVLPLTTSHFICFIIIICNFIVCFLYVRSDNTHCTSQWSYYQSFNFNCKFPNLSAHCCFFSPCYHIHSFFFAVQGFACFSSEKIHGWIECLDNHRIYLFIFLLFHPHSKKIDDPSGERF